MTQKITLYTAEQLKDNGGNFDKALRYLNDKRLSSDYDHELFSIFVDDLVDSRKEKLEERGFYVSDIHIEDYYGVSVSVNASLDGDCFNPIPYHSRNSMIRNLRLSYYPFENLKSKLSEDEWNEKIEVADTKIKAQMDEYEKNSFIYLLLSDPEHREFIEKLYDEYDYRIDFSVFQNSSYPFDIEFFRDCSAYESLQFLYDVAPDLEDIEEYFLAYTVEGEDSELIEDDASAIWEIERKFIQNKLQPIIDKGEVMINEILEEIEQAYIAEKKYYESEEYLSEDINCNPEHYEDDLFTLEGDFISKTEDLEHIYLIKQGVNYTSEDFVLFKQPSEENHPIAV